MAQQDIAAALHRVRSVFQRRPEAGLHEDAPATARWVQGTRVVAHHADGHTVVTDMPAELGGSGDQVTPGWLFRAGLASCAAASIVLRAVSEGVVLSSLEVQARSRSDARGLLGMADAAGEPVYAGPGDMGLHVHISALNATPEGLRALVEAALRQSPIPNAVNQATPLALQIEVGDG
jgi:uncharacterized OsmC-like protein